MSTVLPRQHNRPMEWHLWSPGAVFRRRWSGGCTAARESKTFQRLSAFRGCGVRRFIAASPRTDFGCSMECGDRRRTPEGGRSVHGGGSSTATPTGILAQAAYPRAGRRCDCPTLLLCRGFLLRHLRRLEQLLELRPHFGDLRQCHRPDVGLMGIAGDVVLMMGLGGIERL
jgi:hypothetical protein